MAWVDPYPARVGWGLPTVRTWLNDVGSSLTFLHDPPRARVHRSSGLSVNDNTQTTVSFNQEDIDTDMMVDLGTHADRITMTHQGCYRLATIPRWATPGADTLLYAGIASSDLSAVAQRWASVNSADVPGMCVSGWAVFSAAAYAIVNVIQVSGGALTLDTIEFSAHWVGHGTPSLPGVPA